MITWKKFAWAAFMYGSIGGDKFYFDLMRNTDFLTALHNNPNQLTPDDIKNYLLKFLHQWNTRGVPKSCAGNLHRAIISLQPQLFALRSINACITTAPFKDNILVNGSDCSIESVIKQCYKGINDVKGCGPTATAKILHVLNPNLFVMWDGPIIEHFTEFNEDGAKPEGYCQFLQLMQNDAQAVVRTFNSENNLSPARVNPQSPEEYFSAQLGHSPRKSMAKYLDEYYWVTVTNGVIVPPRWYPGQLS